MTSKRPAQRALAFIALYNERIGQRAVLYATVRKDLLAQFIYHHWGRFERFPPRIEEGGPLLRVLVLD